MTWVSHRLSKKTADQSMIKFLKQSTNTKSGCPASWGAVREVSPLAHTSLSRFITVTVRQWFTWADWCNHVRVFSFFSDPVLVLTQNQTPHLTTSFHSGWWGEASSLIMWPFSTDSGHTVSRQLKPLLTFVRVHSHVFIYLSIAQQSQVNFQTLSSWVTLASVPAILPQSSAI